MGLPVEVNPLFLENQYAIQRSLRFRSSATAYLTRTPGVAGDRQKFTWSGWIKRGTLGGTQTLMSAGVAGTAGDPFFVWQFSSDKLQADYYNGTNDYYVRSAAVYRDCSSWYHAVLAVDSTQATPSDRYKFYMNGQQITNFDAGATNYPSLNLNFPINNTQAQYLCRSGAGSEYVDGYLAEINFIDGQALTPSSFGQYNEFGVWSPRKYGGSYGTNGFYLPFTNTTSAETLAYDLSNSSPELISNGMFVSNVTGWTAAGSGSPSITWQSNHTMRIANSANNAPWAYTTISTVIGQTYYAQAYIFAASIGGTSRSIVLKKADDANYSVNSVDLASTTQAGAPTGLQGTFTATATTTYIIVFADVIGTGTTGIDVSQISASLGAYKKNWNPFNISTTAGTTYDAMTDVPPPSTIQNVRAGNYCVLNPLQLNKATLSNGNLTYVAGSGSTDNYICASTLGLSSGKFYWEVTVTSLTTYLGIGVASITNIGSLVNNNSPVGAGSTSYCVYQDGSKANNNTNSAYQTGGYATGNIVGVAFDIDNGKIWFSKNNVFPNSGDPAAGTNAAFSSIAANTFLPSLSGNTATLDANFGQRPFSYTPPSGFLPLNSNNLPAPTIPNGAKVMAAVAFSGVAGNAQSVVASSTNSGNNPLSTTFKPDLVWTKQRNAVNGNYLNDSVRGASVYISSNGTGGNTTAAQYVTSFDANGFSFGTNGYGAADTVVAWEWNAGSGLSTTPTGGSIAPTNASINVSAGFSIITYTGTGSNATLPHGLGATPYFILVKKTSSSNSWQIYHNALGATKVISFDTAAASTDNTVWNGASPTFNSTVFSLGTETAVNGSGATFVCYIWTPIAGYSSMGSYTGNGSSTDGPFIYCGFRPRFILIKRTDSTGDWLIWDTSRNLYNVTNSKLSPNTSSAEFTGVDVNIDILSNGFKIRNADGAINISSSTQIYAAFAENPFKLALAR